MIIMEVVDRVHCEIAKCVLKNERNIVERILEVHGRDQGKKDNRTF